MSAANNISLKLNFNQVVELVKQLPEKEQKKLVNIIGNGSGEKNKEKHLTVREKRFLKGIEESVEFINNYKKGDKHISLNQVLDEL